MNTILSRTSALALFAAGTVFAQDPNVEDALAAGGCLACGGSMMLIPIIILALNIALLVWVARDSKARGMDNSVIWVILVLFTSVIGLIIYLFTRPPGQLVDCPSCGKKRMDTSAKCPHCGNA
jgi:hypothetical protein